MGSQKYPKMYLHISCVVKNKVSGKLGLMLVLSLEYRSLKSAISESGSCSSIELDLTRTESRPLGGSRGAYQEINKVFWFSAMGDFPCSMAQWPHNARYSVGQCSQRTAEKRLSVSSVKHKWLSKIQCFSTVVAIGFTWKPAVKLNSWVPPRNINLCLIITYLNKPRFPIFNPSSNSSVGDPEAHLINTSLEPRLWVLREENLCLSLVLYLIPYLIQGPGNCSLNCSKPTL